MNRQTWQQINNLHAEGLGKRAIARRLGIHRCTVRIALTASHPPVRSSQPRGSLIDPHRGWLMARLQQYPELSAVRLFEQLKERDYKGGYGVVKRCVAELRPRMKPAYLTLAFAPGECAQVDWGMWHNVDVAGGHRRISFFVMVLCHSRMLYAEFFLGEAMEHWLQAHRNAFTAFGGVPEQVMVDNCKTAVLRARHGDEKAELNPAYEEFARHYGFRIVPCNVRRPNEKGRVENAVGYIRTSFLAGREPGPLSILAPALADWLDNTANRRMHTTTGKPPRQLFDEAERAALRPLPAGPYDCHQIQAAAADIDLTLNAVTLKNLRVTVAGGSLSANGTLNLTDGKPATLDFRARGDHLPLLRNDMLILRANADLRLLGPWQSAALTGTLGAVDSLFYRDIELLPIGKPFTAPSVAALPKIDARPTPDSAMPAPFANWTLNVAVRTQEPFLIRGNLATGRVDAAVRIGGTLGTPLPDGTVGLSNFVAALPFSTLKVKSGTLRFTPATGFDPILELRGVAEPRPYRVDVYAYGKLSDPQLILTSNPPLPENEIMTLLATGTTSSGLGNTQAASSRAIQLFAEEIRRGRVRYTKQLRPLLGLLDRVDFSLAETDPYTSGSLSTATLNLSDRWLVSAGMGQDGTSRVMGIWRVSFR